MNINTDKQVKIEILNWIERVFKALEAVGFNDLDNEDYNVESN